MSFIVYLVLLNFSYARVICEARLQRIIFSVLLCSRLGFPRDRRSSRALGCSFG